jgi:DNA-binding CsgD family transcriptional regulator
MSAIAKSPRARSATSVRPAACRAGTTPSEQRVAALAAGGRSNRQIADELYVTVKAVEWHLGNAYRKLDIRGHDGLQAALAER